MANTKSLDLEAGSSEYARKASPIGMPTGEMTVEVWVKLESQPATNDAMVIVSRIDSNGLNRSFQLVYQDNGGTKRLFAATNGFDAVKNHTLTTATWTHVAITWKNNVIEFFIDGSSIGTDNTTGTPSDQGNEFIIGTPNSGNPIQLFDGLLDEIRLWDDFRSDAEIADNYRQELTGSEAGLVSYYKFNDNLEDSQTSGNNDLTHSGTATFSADIPDWSIAFSIVAAVGAFTLTGIAAALSKGNILVASVGSFALTGIAALFHRTVTMVAVVGAFTLTGVAAVLAFGMRMVASAGSFLLNLGSTRLYSWINRVKPALPTWNERTKPTTSFSNRTKPTSSWVNRK